MRQDCSAFAEGPLHTVGLLEAAHQYSLQDMRGCASTPIPTILPIQERQLKNLNIVAQGMSLHTATTPKLVWQTCA